jgi:multiple sugar transport system permease protein
MNLRLSRIDRENMLWGFLMIAPTFLGLLTFYMWPIVQTFYLSFTEWKAFGKYSWAGMANYEKMVGDTELWGALGNTTAFALVSAPLSIAVAILIAVLMNQNIRGVAAYRAIYFMPVVTIPAAIGMLWKWLYNGDYGLINFVLSLVGIAGPKWLTDPSMALFSIILVSVWMHIGFYMVFFLSGLQAIPSSLYEAASIDGAGAWTSFFRITLPLLSPTIFFVSVISLIEAFQVFDLVFMMIDPASLTLRDTQTVVYLFYKQAFEFNDKGYASAIAFLLFVIILAVTLIQVWFQKKWVHYE